MDLDAARALVPWWVVPGAILAQGAAAFLCAFGLGAILFRLARRAHRRDAAWQERARALYPLRVGLLVASWAIPASIAITIPIVRGGFLGDAQAVGLVAAAGAFSGLALWRRRLTRLVAGHGWTARRTLAAVSTRALVLYPHLWVTLAFALAMPFRFDRTAAILLVAAVTVLFLLLRGAGFRLARAVGLAPPAPPEIAQPVRAAAQQAGIPLAAVHAIDLPEANAYALPFAARIAFTRAALQKLSFGSLLAIAQHELTHVTEPARARRVRTAGLLVPVPVLLLKPIYGARGLVAVLLAVVAALLVGRLLRRRITALEVRADEGARSAEPEPGAYARALGDLYRINLIPPVLRGGIHPSLYDRLVAVGAPPPYPRPPPPSRAARLGLLSILAAVGVVIAAWPSVAALACRDPWVTIALAGGTARDAGQLARSRHAEGRYAEAATYYGAAAQLVPDSPRWPAYKAMSLAAAGERKRAVEALVEAAERAKESTEPCADVLAEAQRRIDGQVR